MAEGSKGVPVRFSQDDESFRVTQRRAYGAVTPGRGITVATMRGRLEDDNTSARGTLVGDWTWGKYDCGATVRFSAAG